MRKYLLLLVSLYSLFCWEQRKTHLQEMKLNGEVKYLKMYEYNDKELNFVKEYFFNRQRNIEKNNNYQKGQLNSEFIYHYDDQGRFSFYEMNFYGDYAKEGKIVFSYNRKGDAIQEEYYENDKLIQYTQNKYDNKHHIILSRIYREEKELSHTEFVYVNKLSWHRCCLKFSILPFRTKFHLQITLISIRFSFPFLFPPY